MRETVQWITGAPTVCTALSVKALLFGRSLYLAFTAAKHAFPGRITRFTLAFCCQQRWDGMCSMVPISTDQ